MSNQYKPIQGSSNELNAIKRGGTRSHEQVNEMYRSGEDSGCSIARQFEVLAKQYDDDIPSALLR
ncbi:hypothetical protein U14_04864 [Candidatus Moduliflexus flocculans]|uniref:Uncharacterized protein n=1 Tax=Candidatus Moduliflexus flocculans TaxID=1499966 RepID=A0A0S6W7A9_9BACT|nr:hypothetical protein U14_04864 [Candidatus Moduliflexus flocculans]